MSSTSDLKSARGRRKQAKPQRKHVAESAEEPVVTSVDVVRCDVSEAMAPDTNHNMQCSSPQGGAVEITMKLVKTEPKDSDDESSRGDVQEYLDRTDTAVVFAEPPSPSHDKTVPLPGAGPLSKDRASPSDLQDDCFIKCSFCGQGLPTFQALKEHVDACHPGGSFRCAQCTATFPSRDQLEKHEQLHPATQQVSCKVCNKTFANVYRLQRHMISHDESAVLRKFKCPECDKAFKFKHHLKEHIRIHSGEKPFKCNNCGKRFSHSGSYSSHMTSKKCLVMNLKMNQRGAMNRALEMKPSTPPQLSAFSNQPMMKRSPTNNNNFPPILPKYNEATAAFFSNFPQQNPFLFPPFQAQNTPYSLSSSLHNLMEQFNNKTPMSNHDVKITEMRDQSPEKEIVIKEEIKEEKEPDEEMKPLPPVESQSSAVSSNGGDLEEVKRILETVSAHVTKQFLQENMQKLSPASCNSECPSVGSGAATPNNEEMSETLSCRFCHKSFISAIDLHQHERYLCQGDEEKSEGLAAKLEDVASKTETNGMSCSGSEDETRSRELMTEDEDGEIDQDGRKVRVRSQISEDQLIILKQNYTLNPRPKREELSRIADQVNLAVRVVQVWFQNNRARDRREGRLVHVPFVPQTPWFSPTETLLSEEPLDLSTKKSQASSPADSPPRSDSEEAVNLTQKPQLFIRPLFQQRSPSPLDTSRLAKMLTQPAMTQPSSYRPPLNGAGPTLGSWIDRMNSYASPDHSTSRSPLPGVAIYNGSSSPGSASDWWRRNMMETPEADEYMYADDTSRRTRLSNEHETDGQRPHKCEICKKAFKHKHHLTEHKRLHSGEKPFQCGKCFKRFSHSGSYSQHMNHRYSYCKPYRE